MKKTIFALLGFCLFFICWECIAQFSEQLAFVLPPPSKTFREIVLYWHRYWLHSIATIQEMVLGFSLALLISFPLAWLMYSSRLVRLFFQPIFIVIQCVPMFALAPLMVLFFGWSLAAIVVPTALMIFFPLTMNTYRGFCAVPRHLVDYFLLHRATNWQLLWKLQLPWALPHIFSGFRISASIAGVGAIAGEWAGAQMGLGMLMLESHRAADPAMLFAALFCLTIITIGFYLLMLLVERWITLRHLPNPLKSLGVAAIIGLVFFVSCNTPIDPPKVRLLLDWLPNPNHVPLYAGLARGFFADEGIDLQVQKVRDSGDAIPYIMTKQADLALSYMPHTVRAQNRGARVLPIAVLIDQPLNCLIYRTDRKISKPSDLNGKNVGYSVDGSGCRFLETVLANNHIIPKGLHNVSFGLVTTLSLGQVDALYGGYWNIECEQLKLKGIETDHFSLQELGVPCYYELIVIALEGSYQAEPAFISRFQRALQRSIDYVKEYPDDAFAIYLAANPDKSLKAIAWEENSWKVTKDLFASSQTIDRDVWQTFIAWLQAHQLLEIHI